jgi:hypothetical protein
MFGALWHRNHVDLIVMFRMGDDHDPAVQQAERDKTLFPIVEAVILEGESRTLKDR